MLGVACSSPQPTRPPSAPGTTNGHDWPTFGFDAGRSSSSTAPTGITAANVGTLQQQRIAIAGTVDASAIYLHAVQAKGASRDVFFVTTTYGETLAIDASDGTVLWTFTPSGYQSWAGSYRITNSTPVADPDRTAIYAASPDGQVRKLAIADGHVLWSATVTTLPTREKVASPLAWDRGHIVVVTGGYIGDAPPYQGHVVVLDAASGSVLHGWNSLCSDRAGVLDPSSCAQSGSAIWGRAGAVVDTTTGDLLVATGNGLWDGRTNWGDAVLELDPDATRLLANYTPTNTQQLDASDADVGSTSPVLLDAKHLLQGGKDGWLRVLGRAAIADTAPHLGGELQMVRTPGGAELLTAPAVARTGGLTRVYVADDGGTAAWTFTGDSLIPAWSNANAGTSPVVAGGLLFVYDPGGALHVYDAVNGSEVARFSCGSGHWNSPIVADGRIALPTGNANDHATSGELYVWRLPATASGP